MANYQEEDGIMVVRDEVFLHDINVNRRNLILSNVRATAQASMVLSFFPTSSFQIAIDPRVDDDDDDYEEATEFADWEPEFQPERREYIKELERVKVDEDLKEEAGCCCICFDGFETGGEAIRMPCSHLFHGDCIVKWLDIRNLCPLCRFALPS